MIRTKSLHFLCINLFSGSQPEKLRKIINTWKMSPDGLDICLEHDEHVQFMTDCGTEVNSQLGRLKIKDIHDELFFLAHSIIDGIGINSKL